MRVIGRLILSAILLVLTGLLMAVASFAPGLFFGFYTDFSKQILQTIAGVTGQLPFALWEWLLVLIVLIVFWALAKNRKFIRWLIGIVTACCFGALVFMALWGLNYFAPSVAEQIGLQEQTYSVEQLRQTVVYFADQAGQAANEVERDSDGSMVRDLDSWTQQAGKGYEVLAQSNEFFRDAGGPVKKLMSGKLFSHMGFTGIFVPFTAEANVNPDSNVVGMPFTMCHEIAHRLTVARENEANFCAFLACLEHDDPDFVYSGWYSAFLYVYNALYKQDRTAALAVADSLDETLRRDINAANAHYAQYDSPVQEAAQKVNDVYLKTVGDEDGSESYGKAADLLVAWYIQTGGR